MYVYPLGTCKHHATFNMWYHFWQYPWDLGSVQAEWVGQGEVGRLQHWAEITLLLLGLNVESPWWALSEPFSQLLHSTFKLL